jgi:co-chaperonin GroES (HSP10)
MPLHPLGNRVLVKPDAQPTTSESGLILLEDRHYIAMSGEVVAIARGPNSAHRLRAATIARCQRILDEVADRVPAGALHVELHKAFARYAMEQCTLPSVLEGDQVCFPYTAGHDVTIDGERFVLIKEDDLEAVWQPDRVTVEAVA